MPQTRPNVLLILTDQMRSHAMGCSGNPNVRTPHLDALAERGTRFTNAVANCPVCTPSRAMLFTGKYPLSNRTLVNDLAMPTDQAFVAESFRDAGYAAGYIGKWHLDGIPREKFTPPGPRRAGFDAFWAAYNCHHDYLHPKWYLDTDELVEMDGYEPALQTDLAIEFMAGHEQRPFFLTLAWGPPHAPYELVPDEYRAMYPTDDTPLRANCVDPDARACCDYYAQVSALDEQVGRITAFLAEAQLDRDTIVVFTSDHGDMLWSHGRQKKQQPWEESISIPLIMRWPEHIPAGAVSDALVGMADLAPTLLGMAGVGIPGEMEGVDVSKALLGAEKGYTSLPIFDYVPVDQAWDWGGREWRGVRTKTHTYARFQDEGWVLYDNVKDPCQQDNLIGRPEHANLQARLEAELREWLGRLGDAFLTGDEHLDALGQLAMFRERNDHFPWSRGHLNRREV